MVKDKDYRTWFRTSDVKANACEVLHRLQLAQSEQGGLGEMDLSNSSLEEMFNIQPSILTCKALSEHEHINNILHLLHAYTLGPKHSSPHAYFRT
jgi:hypothetical protein